MKLCYASTLFGAMTLAAAADEGLLGVGPRTLVVSNNAAIPEITPALDETPGFAAIRGRFDRVVSWNEIIAPMHPSDWKPRAIETPMLSRLIAARLGEPDEVVLESIAVPPAKTLAGLLKECPLTVYADGLMSYGPTRDPLPQEIWSRVTRLIHLDLVPGLRPILLSEYGVAPVALPDAAFTRVVGRMDAQAPAGQALILGQYLAALGVLTPAEEADLHRAMLRGVAARGHRTVVFKAHPAAGRRHARELRPLARELGVELLVARETLPAEVIFATAPPKLVVGCFSTALVTAARFYGLPAATVGTSLLLERLTPYENSNRIPVTIADATLPRLAEDGALTEPPAVGLTALASAVAYCMQSVAHPGLREAAETYLAGHGHARYFRKKRLEVLGLIEPPKPRAASQPKGLRRLLGTR
ncbi:hypothetical protein J5X84_35155 [Streptosporangiaceae bacterium NEAU-GS5]|nr:hypothetical protein [Streptosporangiaceae bacterium NEAU-GS5]